MPSYKEKAEFYRTFATLSAAGIPLTEALKTKSKQEGYESLTEVINKIQRQKSTFAQSINTLPRLFSPFECEMIALGEVSGKLDHSFNNIAQWFELLHKVRAQVLSSLMHPLLIIHIAPVLLGLPELVSTGCVPCFLKSVCLSILPLYLGGFFILKGIPWIRTQQPDLALSIDSQILKIPLLSMIVCNIDLARYTRALSFCLDAGMQIEPALRSAEAVVVNKRIKNKLRKIYPSIKKGESLVLALMSSGMFDERALGSLHVGEVSGKNVEMLLRMHDSYFSDFETTLDRASKIVPVIIFILVGIYIGIKIIAGYKGLWAGASSL